MDAKTLGAQPAYPMPEGVCMTPEGIYRANPLDGLTKREAFAMAALQGIRSNPYWNEHTSDYSSEAVARDAVADADRLLAELAKEQTP